MKNALITGGSRGIGFAVAEQLKSDGYNVFSPTHKEMDLSIPESVELFCDKYKSATFDVLINNAGINDINFVDNITDDEIYRMSEINLLSPLRLIRSVAVNMKKQNYGRIVNIGSIWGIVGKPGRSMYAITKHGIQGITKTLAVELAPYNILINTVCPGYTLTELTRKNNSEEEIKSISESIPIRRMATPEEQAKLICFLAEDTNTYITGQQIAVDGGFTSQ